MAMSTSTLTRIPAVYAVAVTIDSGRTHLVADDVYTVSMVLLGQRPFTALCGTQAAHGSPMTRVGEDCEVCARIATERGLRRSDRRPR